MVKLPAAVGVVAIAVVWARGRPGRPAGAAVFALAAATGVGVAAAVSVMSGLGFGWLSPAAMLTPMGDSIALTPTTAFGDTVARLGAALGVGIPVAPVVGLLRVVSLAGAAALAVVAVVRCRAETLTVSVAAILLAAALAGPALWPWYLTWSFVLLAAVPGGQRSGAMTVASVGACLMLSPAGHILVPTPDAPVVAVLWVAVAWVALRRWKAGSWGRSLL